MEAVHAKHENVIEAVKSEGQTVKYGVVRVFPAILLFAMVVQTAGAQRKDLSADALVKQCADQLAGIEDYVVDLEATIDMERVRIPAMKAVLYYKAPDKIHFESPNFALLPREGFALPVKELSERYEATTKGKEMIGDVRTEKLLLVAKDPGTRLQQLFAWIDPVTRTVLQTETVPYRGRSAKVRFTYSLQADRYWLPATLEATFGAVGADTAGAEVSVPAAPQLEEFRRPVRRGSMVIRYSNYRINAGLSDERFETSMSGEKK